MGMGFVWARLGPLPILRWNGGSSVVGHDSSTRGLINVFLASRIEK